MDYNIQSNETEVDLVRLWFTILNKWRVIIFAGMIGALFFGLISTLKVTVEPKVIPTYESTTTVQITFPEENSDQLKAALELTRSRAVLDLVNRNIKTGIDTDELLELISVESQNGDNMVTLKIRVLNEKPKLAMDIADEIRELSTKFISGAMDIESFKVLEQANLPDKPIYEEYPERTPNNIIKKAVTGGILGVIAAVLIIFIKFALNDKIQTRDDVERYLGKRVLTTIPMMPDKSINKTKKTGIKG